MAEKEETKEPIEAEQADEESADETKPGEQTGEGATAAKKKKNKKKKKKAAAGAAANTTTAAAPAPAPAPTPAPAPAPASASAPVEPPPQRTRAPPAAVAAAAAPATAAQGGQPEALMSALAATLARLKQQQDPTSHQYKFWDTQPVPKLAENPKLPAGPIEGEKKKEELRPEPLPLPAGFEWIAVDISVPETLEDLYVLLRDNYVEDDECMFRFDYSKGFLQWALQPPGWKMVWHAGVVNSKTRKLLAFISAVPATMSLNKESNVPLVEINFLCVHKKLRDKRLAPVLIQEITRRVNLEGLFQAVYTAGSVLPRPVAECTYYHRSLNPKKLLDVKFSHLPRGSSLPNFIKKYKLAETTKLPLRPMTPADVPAVTRLLVNFLAKFRLAPFMSEEDVAHWFLPRADIIQTYVLEDANHVATDMVSFYLLPSTIVNNPDHKTLYAAYSYYTVGTTVSLKDLVADALILAANLGCDVFNALNLMDNGTFLEPLEFGKGDGNLRYYLFNYRMPPCKPEEIGLVLL